VELLDLGQAVKFHIGEQGGVELYPDRLAHIFVMLELLKIFDSEISHKHEKKLLLAIVSAFFIVLCDRDDYIGCQ
jgi:hypothetical protein